MGETSQLTLKSTAASITAAQTGQTVLAQRSEYAADIRDLKAAIDTTRRALDPKALAEHVAQNNDAFIGDLTQKFANALNTNAERDRDLRDTSRAFQSLATKLHSETALLSGLASRLEERDERSKWDWVTLAAGMVGAALLAGAGAFFAAKANIVRNDFQRSVALITQDDDAGWCNIANAPIIQDRNGINYCAIAMPDYPATEAEEGGE